MGLSNLFFLQIRSTRSVVVLLPKLTTQNKHLYRTETFLQLIVCTKRLAIGQTKALVVNGNTQTVSCFGHFCALGVLWWDGTDTHHTEAWTQPLKSSYDIIWEGENNQDFVTTKQYTVLVQTRLTKTILGLTLEKKTITKVKHKINC